MPKIRASNNLITNYTKRIQSGFTLLEIMVVTAIIGVMATLLVGAVMQDNDRTAKLEAERFMAVLAELQDEAVLAGVPFSVQFCGGGYTTTTALTDSSGGGDDSLLKQRRLQDGVTMRSEIFSVDDESEDENGEPLPAAVLIDTMGETTGFEVRFVGDDTQYIVFINEQGQLSLKASPL